MILHEHKTQSFICTSTHFQRNTSLKNPFWGSHYSFPHWIIMGHTKHDLFQMVKSFRCSFTLNHSLFLWLHTCDCVNLWCFIIASKKPLKRTKLKIIEKIPRMLFDFDFCIDCNLTFWHIATIEFLCCGRLSLLITIFGWINYLWWKNSLMQLFAPSKPESKHT